MNTINVFKDENGKIVGTTTDLNSGVSISIDSPEYQTYLEELSKPPVPTWDTIRIQRDSLLKDSDWAIISDATPKPSKEAWLTYRQALRDIPQNFSTPEEVVWPDKPEA